MNTFRGLLRSSLGRLLTSAIIVSTLHVSADPSNYLTVLAQEQQKEAEIRAIAAKMNVDPEFLLNPQGYKGFDFRSLFRQIAERFGIQSENVVATNDQPVDIRESVKRVKERYALVAADTVLARIVELVQLSPDAVRGRRKVRSRPSCSPRCA